MRLSENDKALIKKVHDCSKVMVLEDY